MSYENPKDRRKNRHRINLNDDLDAAVRALARLKRKQPATLLAEIIEAHVHSLASDQRNDKEMVRHCA